ncbi:MAG TPA: hypothetical protein VKM55_10280 [Candidatus Lokiarchaeia archaeon]|nr:hypothetical protein [Candidatus Lokiarchaeia archaeon]
MGGLIYAIGGNLVAPGIINILLPIFTRNFIYTGSMVLQIAGLICWSYGGLNFRRINKAAMNYYSSRKICIVHRGKIQGTPFMCATCGVLYCAMCKDAIVYAENQCWNCKSVLSPLTLQSMPQDSEGQAKPVNDLQDVSNINENSEDAGKSSIQGESFPKKGIIGKKMPIHSNGAAAKK